MSQEELFIRRSCAFARTLPFAEAVSYLRGMLSVCGDHEMVQIIRQSFPHLSHCDTELELIATGQMRLNLANPRLQ